MPVRGAWPHPFSAPRGGEKKVHRSKPAGRREGLARSTKKTQARSTGFTLIEVLVGLALVALLAVMSWRGLDALSRSQAQLQERSAALASLQAALSQWTLDLEQALETPYVNSIAWDGRQLRVVRRSLAEDALVVVAWGQRLEAGGLQWRRWQSAPLRDRAALLQAWNDAPAQLAGSDAARVPEAVSLLPIEAWDLRFHMGAGWVPPPSLMAKLAAGVDPQLQEPPGGVRLRLQLPAAAGLPGALQLDWTHPSQNRGRS